MQRAASVDAFLRDPIGRYFLGRRHIVFAESADFVGHVSWGKPDVADVREMLACCAFILTHATPVAWLVDLRALEGVDPGTFGLMLDFTRRNGQRLGRVILRQAQLRPPGLVGAIISGFSQVALLPYEERVFGDVDAAIAWLHIADARGADVLALLDRARDGVLGESAVVARVRSELDIAGPLPLDVMARRLSLSGRTLQRALREKGTSYRNEVASFRIRRARDLLANGERPLAWVATESGFASVQQFTTSFRRATGEPPGAWRARTLGQMRPEHGESPS